MLDAGILKKVPPAKKLLKVNLYQDQDLHVSKLLSYKKASSPSQAAPKSAWRKNSSSRVGQCVNSAQENPPEPSPGN